MIPPGKVVQDKDHDSASDQVPLTESALGDSQAGGSLEYFEAFELHITGTDENISTALSTRSSSSEHSTVSQITPRKLKSK